MVLRRRGVNDARLDHDQRHDRIGRLVHDMHDASETFRIRRDAGKRIGNAWPTFRMQKDGICFVSGARFAHRLTRAGDGRCLRRPVLAALALRLQRVVAGRDSAGFPDEPVFVRAESTEVSLLSVNMHRARRPAVRGIIPLDHHSKPTVLRAFGLLARVALRSVNGLRPGQPSHKGSDGLVGPNARRPGAAHHQKLCGTSIWSPGSRMMSSEGLARTALMSMSCARPPRMRRTLR